MLLMGLLLVLAVLLPNAYGQAIADASSGSGRLACEESGLCSLGRVKGCTGDVRSSPAFKACLEARSFRRELILLTETRLNPAFQTFSNLLSLGYEHVVLLSLQEACARSEAAWPRLACVWSSQHFMSTTKYLLDRVVFLTRAARLSTNVLMLDSDVVLFGDVYPHLKAPPLGHTTLATMRDGNGWINCGVVYVQNARPDGPTAYALAEIVDRLERWAEGATFISAHGNPAHCWDQQMYSDAVMSALAGRPISYGCWFRHDAVRRAAWDVAHQKVFGTQETGPLETRHYLQADSMPWPTNLAAAGYPHKQAEVWTGEMHVPNTRGEWPAELGGEMYPPERGPISKAWMGILKSDVLPLWPDPEDPAQAAAGANLTELFGFLPLWLGESWSNGGALGWWNSALRRPAGQPPTVALAHMVHVPGGASNKLTVKMASANWDWDIAHAAQTNHGVLFASTPAMPLPDVLAFSPEVEGREWASEEEFGAATRSLLRLAMETGRAAAYPAARCNVSWHVTGGTTRNNALPLTVNHGVTIPYSPADKGFSDLRCLWGGYLPYGCLAVRWYFSGGLLAPEYDHLRQLLAAPDGAVAASAANLTRLGFASAATTHSSLRDTIRNSSGSSAVVVNVPAEMLQPPLGADAWDVTALAAKLMAAFGGPGSGLLHSMAAAMPARGGAGGGSGAAGNNGGSAGGSSSPRPLVLVLPEVPRLTEKEGPRHSVFRRQLETGEDRHQMSCEWMRTGRPYHRRRGRQR